MSNAPTGPIVFFGDSLTDSGNLFEQAQGLINEDIRLALGGPNGQASDGPTWAESIDEQLGLAPSQNLNYAVAGAEAIGGQALGDFIVGAGYETSLLVPLSDPGLQWDMNLGAQIDRFLSDVAGQSLTTYTAVLLIGANDLGAVDLEGRPSAVLADAAATVDGVVESVVAAVTELANSGVGTIVVSALFELSIFPVFDGVPDALIGLVDQFVVDLNTAVEAALTELNETMGEQTNFVFMDMTQISSALLDDPTSFGLIAPPTLSLTEGDPDVVAQYDADQVSFWDSIHPSAATHGVISGFAAHALETDGSATALTDDDDHDRFGGLGQQSLVFGYGGDDALRAATGDDTVFGGSGDDFLFGGLGADIVSGGSGDDQVNGQNGRDVLDGGQGNDLIDGRGGQDVLIDGLGSDSAFGGVGDDLFIWTEASLIGGANGVDSDTFYGGHGDDTLYVALSSESYETFSQLTAEDARAAAVTDLGLTLDDLETIIFVEGRDGLDVLSDDVWFDQADLWGLI